VLEGGSAIALREAMPTEGHLGLVDPYESTIPGVSPRQIVAHRLLRFCSRGTVTWIKKYSQPAGLSWTGPKVDLIYIDADHSFEGVSGDWDAWRPHLSATAVAIFDDANPPGALGDGRWRTKRR
jgi:hypothetical protein